MLLISCFWSVSDHMLGEALGLTSPSRVYSGLRIYHPHLSYLPYLRRVGPSPRYMQSKRW